MCPIRHTRYRPPVLEQNNEPQQPGPMSAAVARLDPGGDPAASTLLRKVAGDIDVRIAREQLASEVAWPGFPSPGPKEVRRRLRAIAHARRAGRRRRPPRLAVLPLDVDYVEAPPRLPTDPPPPPDDHPFEFGSIWYRRDGSHIPIHPESVYFAELRKLEDIRARRVAKTQLFDRGARIAVSTVFLGWNGSLGTHPPLLWETMIFLGEGTGDDAGTWRYSTEAAAWRGHINIVAAIRAGRADRRSPARVRPASAPGPWRHGYPARWR